MINFDLKNRKILYELDVDSRQPYLNIARNVGLSKDAVIYRINKLMKAGIIKKFHTIIDNGKLGLIPFRLYLKFKNTTPEIEQEIIEYLKKQKDVVWLVSIDGEFDIGLATYVQSIKIMNLFWKKLFSTYRNYIDKRWLTIYTKVSYYPRSFFIDLKENYIEHVCFTEPDNNYIEKNDIEILKLMAPNSRITVVELANKLNLTAKTITKKIRNLEKSGIIVGYKTMFDLEKLGIQYFKVHISVKDLTNQKEKAMRSYILRHPNIIYDNEILGGYDIEIEVQVKSLNELRKVLNDMKRQFPKTIINYTYMLFYKEHKYVFFPL